MFSTGGTVAEPRHGASSTLGPKPDISPLIGMSLRLGGREWVGPAHHWVMIFLSQQPQGARGRGRGSGHRTGTLCSLHLTLNSFLNENCTREREAALGTATCRSCDRASELAAATRRIRQTPCHASPGFLDHRLFVSSCFPLAVGNILPVQLVPWLHRRRPQPDSFGGLSGNDHHASKRVTLAAAAWILAAPKGLHYGVGTSRNGLPTRLHCHVDRHGPGGVEARLTSMFAMVVVMLSNKPRVEDLTEYTS